MCLTERMRELSRIVYKVILYKVILNLFKHRKFKSFVSSSANFLQPLLNILIKSIISTKSWLHCIHIFNNVLFVCIHLFTWRQTKISIITLFCSKCSVLQADMKLTLLMRVPGLLLPLSCLSSYQVNWFPVISCVK